jgi:hypothetical protein
MSMRGHLTKRNKAIVERATGPILKKWQERVARLLGKYEYTGTDHVLAAYMQEAEELFVEQAKELAMVAGGECGPVEMATLSSACAQHGIGMFLLHAGRNQEVCTTHDGLTLLRAGSQMVEQARASMMQALTLSMTVAKHRAPDRSDPLAAFMTVPSADDPAR